MRITLTDIVNNRKLEVEQLKQAKLLESLPPVKKENAGFLDCASPQVISLICEIKLKSPDYPAVRHIQIEELVEAYSTEAAAISILTEEKFFGGSFELLLRSRACTNLPLLCKDFVLDVYQCWLARACGAQAVLLIAKILNDETLSLLKQEIESLGMVAVMEVQNETEMQRVLNLDPQVILINNRNLDTFEVDLATTAKLAPLVPGGVQVISASGIDNHAQIKQLMPYCSVFLIGSALMHTNGLPAKMVQLKGLQMPSNSTKQGVH